MAIFRYFAEVAYFYLEQLQLPVLDDGDDGMWHEYEKVEITDAEVTDERAIEEMIGLLGRAQVVV